MNLAPSDCDSGGLPFAEPPSARAAANKLDIRSHIALDKSRIGATAQNSEWLVPSVYPGREKAKVAHGSSAGWGGGVGGQWLD